jgi:aminopeptidase N
MRLHKVDHSTLCYRLFLITCTLLLTLTQALAARKERHIDAWRPLHYSINLTFNDSLAEIVKAQAEITIVTLEDGVSLVDFDFGEMPVDSVAVDARSARFERRPGLLNIYLPAPARKGAKFVIAVIYHGRPKDGLILGPDKDGKPSATGDNWPDRVHHWIPCLDHPSAKATASFRVTVPARDRVVANGKLVRVTDGSKATRTWSYTEGIPIPPYCMVIAVGEFASFNPKKVSVTTLSYYVPQSDRNLAVQGFAPATPSLKFFSQTVAPYPYEKLALIVGATRFGGMENSSAIVFTSTLFDAATTSQPMSKVFNIRSGIVEVVAHEIAHQWFGDSVTESTWSDLWLSEGFATYFAGLFIQRYEGEIPFRAYMQSAAEAYLHYAQERRAPIFDSDTEDLLKLLNANNYQKGAWVLHMLRMELGDGPFFRGIRSYYEAHKGTTASSEDLRAALEKTSGRNLKDFFASWIYGSGHPQYELSWGWQKETRKVKLLLRQLQPEPAFPNLLPVDLITSRGKQRIVLKPMSKEAIQEIELDQAPSSVNVDPENTVLKEASVKVVNRQDAKSF